MSIGHRITHYRIMRAMSIADMSRATKIVAKTLLKIEFDVIVPDQHVINVIAKALRVTAIELYDPFAPSIIKSIESNISLPHEGGPPHERAPFHAASHSVIEYQYDLRTCLFTDKDYQIVCIIKVQRNIKIRKQIETIVKQVLKEAELDKKGIIKSLDLDKKPIDISITRKNETDIHVEYPMYSDLGWFFKMHI